MDSKPFICGNPLLWFCFQWSLLAFNFLKCNWLELKTNWNEQWKLVLYFCQERNNSSITNTEVVLAKGIKWMMDRANFIQDIRKEKCSSLRKPPAERESFLTQLNCSWKPYENFFPNSLEDFVRSSCSNWWTLSSSPTKLKDLKLFMSHLRKFIV